MKIDSLSARTDRGFEIVSQRFQAMQDQLAAASEQIVEMRADHQELSRTLKGRARLLEDRFGKMLEALGDETASRKDLEALEARVKALEDKDSAA